MFTQAFLQPELVGLNIVPEYQAEKTDPEDAMELLAAQWSEHLAEQELLLWISRDRKPPTPLNMALDERLIQCRLNRANIERKVYLGVLSTPREDSNAHSNGKISL